MPEIRASLPSLIRIRDVLVRAENAERTAYLELRVPGARERWLAAQAARVDFDEIVLANARVDIELDLRDDATGAAR